MVHKPANHRGKALTGIIELRITINSLADDSSNIQAWIQGLNANESDKELQPTVFQMIHKPANYLSMRHYSRGTCSIDPCFSINWYRNIEIDNIDQITRGVSTGKKYGASTIYRGSRVSSWRPGGHGFIS